MTAERLAASLQRLSDLATSPNPMPPPPGAPFVLDDRVFVKSCHTTRFVPINEIVSISSCENYTEL
ncbi:MAG: hypothetical protein J6386_09450 [Candidatus Synoicihabitans palmerolidicus]|nr:hypothetical protein [Candidatus Synoicihabitans palmerolidicus]